MNKVYQKVIFFGLIAFILMFWKIEYSYVYLIGYVAVVLYLLYEAQTSYKAQLALYRIKKNSEIKEVEGEKNFNEDVLKSLIRTMNMPMLFVDKDGIIVFTNQSFRETFAIKHLRGKGYKDVFSGQLLSIVEQSYVFEQKFSTIVCIEERYYQVEATPLFNDKVFNGSILLFTDVSQMKEMEKMQKQFFSDISHELKTPMSAIIGSAEILQRDGIKNNETFQEFMSILLKESHRMQNIINDILELSRLEQPQVTIEPSNVNIESMIKESIELFESLAKEKHISLIYQNDIHKEIMVDYTTIKTVMNNLVSNAIKYSNDGVITIKAKCYEEKLVLTVQDEGVGIAPENIPFIFDRFFQVDRSRSKKAGTGLGLSIVKRMVELNNGDIVVDSTLGIGSTFTVTIPLA